MNHFFIWLSRYSLNSCFIKGWRQSFAKTKLTTKLWVHYLMSKVISDCSVLVITACPLYRGVRYIGSVYYIGMSIMSMCPIYRGVRYIGSVYYIGLSVISMCPIYRGVRYIGSVYYIWLSVISMCPIYRGVHKAIVVFIEFLLSRGITVNIDSLLSGNLRLRTLNHGPEGVRYKESSPYILDHYPNNIALP